MIILSWNCRGSARSSTVQELVDLCKRINPAVLFLMETRANKGRVENLKVKLWFDDCWCVEANGLSGGLGLFRKKDIELEVLKESQNFIHAKCREKVGGAFWICCFVYGNPNFKDRRLLWDRLQCLQLAPGTPWMCIGDFNQILNEEEK